MKTKKAFRNPFKNHAIRVSGTPDNPLFCAVDVCASLGLEHHLLRFPAEEVVLLKTADRNGKKRELCFLTEPGFYRLIFLSDHPDADEFKNWVLREVLPQIRKTGGFTTARQEEETFLPCAEALLEILIEQERLNDRIERLLSQASLTEPTSINH